MSLKKASKDRYVVEFGLATHSTSFLEHPQYNTRFLACDPLLNEYHKQEKFEKEFIVPKTVSFSQIDEVAIAGYDGEIEIQYDLSNLWISGTPDIEPYHGCNKQTKLVKCLTLDSWFNQYSDQGFMTQIDLLNVCLNGSDADPIFEEFSFDVRPDLIVIRQHQLAERSIERMEKHGYRVQIMSFGAAIVVGSKC